MPPTTVTDPDVTAAYPRRPRPGIVMGLRGGQVALLSTAGLLLLLVTFTGAFPSLSRGAVLGISGVLVLLAVATVQDRPAYRWLAGRISHAARAGRGNTTMARPIKAGTIREPRLDRGLGLLPGRAAAITVHELDGAGYLYHPHAGTLTGIIEVTSPEFLLRDPADRNARVNGWGRVLAAATRTGVVRQVQLLERSIPDDGSALAAYTDTHLTTEPVQLTLADTYRDLTGHLRGGADRHQSFLAITIDRSAATSRVKAAGGQITGLIATWRQEYTLLARLLPAAGLDVIDELSPRRIAEVIRTGYDPSTALHLCGDGIDPASAGPSGGREEWDHLRTDGSFHAVLWVAEWPTSHVPADVLWPIVFPPGVQRTLSLFYKPYTRTQSESAIRAKHSEIIQSSWLKDKLGRVETLADGKELDDVLVREGELLAGHGEVGLLGMVTVSARSLDDLDAAITTVHAAATQAGLDLRRVYGQQLQAFTAAALPLGIPVVT
ncbi:MAG TPA: hypothetical protein DCQ36_07185 [Actinobacteria bacterium]|nr:hypothetical protein [Actinomycetota bacterium]